MITPQIVDDLENKGNGRVYLDLDNNHLHITLDEIIDNVIASKEVMAFIRNKYGANEKTFVNILGI
jgi:hypothetical protein